MVGVSYNSELLVFQNHEGVRFYIGVNFFPHMNFFFGEFIFIEGDRTKLNHYEYENNRNTRI